MLGKLYRLCFSDARDENLKRENANIDGNSAMGTMLRIGSEASKEMYSEMVMDRRFSDAHKCGDIHIHDMDFYALTTTCTQIDLVKLFEHGFCTGHGVLRSPQSIQSYAALACIAIQANQNDQHGGQSIVNFDYAMADGVRKTFAKTYFKNLRRFAEFSGLTTSQVDDAERNLRHPVPTLERCAAFDDALRGYLVDWPAELVDRALGQVHAATVRDVDCATYQAMEALIHNLNTMNSRAGAQVPFSSINYGMDTSPEARMAVRNLLLATEAGLGNGETPIFPIQIFRVKEGVNYNPGDPNYDLFKLAIRTSAKRLFPNFSFQDAPFNLKYYRDGHPETEIAYMGCRTRVIGNVYDPSREISNGRGNLSFTSINLPRLAIKANHDMHKFFVMLDNMLELVAEQLLERFEIVSRRKVKNSPFLMGEHVWLDSEKLGWDDEIGEVLKHGTLSIGFIGLAEALVALTGHHHGEGDEYQALGLKIVGRIREFCDAMSEERKLNFTCLATPAEGLSGRFVKLDREKFGVIPGVTDRDYYTNSFHIPVYFDIRAARKIALEAPYHALTNAGHISYVELDGDPTGNLEAFERIVRYMHDCGIGYGSINHPVDRDPVCGYTGIIGDECPKCGRKEGRLKFERIRRITGYLVGTLDRFNDAKRAEEHDRVKHG